MTEFDIKTPDNETVTLDVEEFSAIQKARWAAKAPDELIQDEPEDLSLTPDIIDYFIELAEYQTDLTEELISELGMRELNRLIKGVAGYSFGSDVDLEGELNDFKRDDSIELNDDGSVDLEDWR